MLHMNWADLAAAVQYKYCEPQWAMSHVVTVVLLQSCKALAPHASRASDYYLSARSPAICMSIYDMLLLLPCLLCRQTQQKRAAHWL